MRSHYILAKYNVFFFCSASQPGEGVAPRGVESNKSIPKQPTVEGPRTRLMITHMVLENFKSYAGVQEIGPFHHVRNF